MRCLIERARAGDDGAFRRIVESYEARLLSFCRFRLGSEDEALDAVQEVLTRAWRALPGFRTDGNFASWLFAIAANHVRGRFRVRTSEARKVEAAGREQAVQAAADPAEEAANAMRMEELRTAVAGLPGELRSPVELYYFAGLSVGETAETLHLGEEAVKSRLFRARKRIRAALEGEQPRGDRGDTIQ